MNREALEQENSDRLRALAERGCQVTPQSLADLRVLSYIEVLLGERLGEAQLHFEEALSGQLTAAEAQADQMESLQRQARLMQTGGVGPR